MFLLMWHTDCLLSKSFISHTAKLTAVLTWYKIMNGGLLRDFGWYSKQIHNFQPRDMCSLLFSLIFMVCSSSAAVLSPGPVRIKLFQKCCYEWLDLRVQKVGKSSPIQIFERWMMVTQNAHPQLLSQPIAELRKVKMWAWHHTSHSFSFSTSWSRWKSSCRLVCFPWFCWSKAVEAHLWESPCIICCPRQLHNKI